MALLALTEYVHIAAVPDQVLVSLEVTHDDEESPRLPHT